MKIIVPFYSQLTWSLTPHSPTGAVSYTHLPYLKVYDKTNKLVSSYKYGVDFKEAFINFRVNHITFDNTNEFKVLPTIMKGTSSSNNSIVFLSSPVDSFNFRSSFIEDVYKRQPLNTEFIIY